MGADRCCMIIDEHPVVRLGIRQLLEPDWDFEELPHGAEATDLLTSVGSFDVAIVDMRAANGRSVPSGRATIVALHRAQPSLSVVAHSVASESHAVREAIDAGASAYVNKRSAPETMRAAITSALAQELFVDPVAEAPNGLPSGLTPRQREILQHYADGRSTDEIAKRLGLSSATVRTHAKASLPRLAAENRAHAIAIALRNSMID